MTDADPNPIKLRTQNTPLVAESGLWRGDPGAGGVPADPAGAQHQVPAFIMISEFQHLFCQFFSIFTQEIGNFAKKFNEPFQGPPTPFLIEN